jgi:hypothetical protein
MNERDPEWCHTHQRPGNDGHENPEVLPTDERTDQEQQPETD